MDALTPTDCDSLYTIKDYEGHVLGFAQPNDLFIQIDDVSTNELFDSAVEELNGYWERRCWLLCDHQDDDAIELAQRSGFFWLSPGVWFRIGDGRV